MSPDEIKGLCEELACTTRELAATLGLEHKTVSAWLQGELFPTRRHVRQMQSLRSAGPSAVVRQRRGRKAVTPMQRLAEPEFWGVFRKLLEHQALFDQVSKLAADYADPTDNPKADQ